MCWGPRRFSSSLALFTRKAPLGLLTPPVSPSLVLCTRPAGQGLWELTAAGGAFLKALHRLGGVYATLPHQGLSSINRALLGCPVSEDHK